MKKKTNDKNQSALYPAHFVYNMGWMQQGITVTNITDKEMSYAIPRFLNFVVCVDE